MTSPFRSDPLLVLAGERFGPDFEEQSTGEESSQYSVKPDSAPPYCSSATDSRRADASSPTIIRSPSPPPDYNAWDPLARDFHLGGTFIYASSTNTPHYQIKLTATASGRPQQLHLRRLTPTEIRRAHRASTSSASAVTQQSNYSLTRTTTGPARPPSFLQHPTDPPSTPYDPDATTYIATLYPTATIEIRGQRASTLPSYLSITPSPFSSATTATSTTTFHHHTRNKRFDALDPAHEARIQRYGYHAKDEWVEKVLFSARRGGRWAKFWERRGKGVVEWVDGQGRLCAVESEEEEEAGGGQVTRRLRLEAGAKAVTEMKVRDVLVMCWVVRLWRMLADQ
ncbi:hypothetical protein B0J12DRAFT_737210 [Macrophomina phaseolina]|uniref:Uncharacterized protein n=1 Tax=Macrophomina phaseolina TaxID=35725 RepID=A0ABQ8GMS3_9PEZI|nr:hypothetical protein B0J12DRAFT_737210 [Macrophomina phaseolina]